MCEALGYVAVCSESWQHAHVIMDSVCVNIMMLSLAPDDPDGVALAEKAKLRQLEVKILVANGLNIPEALNRLADGYIQNRSRCNSLINQLFA